MSEEIEKGNMDEVKAIAVDILENEKKINHHGKRADSIVKGMLQHSRRSTGQKELTDINALLDEYLKLSYQAYRSKEQSFNSTIEIHFDAGMDKIEVVPQDLGRVFLNLFNNAFYAVNEQRKLAEGIYEPRIVVSTSKMGSNIKIGVKDNGTGIPLEILDRIYNPFFTTKPTGEGTGLGLSLSYDIIKAHGGDIQVETINGEGTAFVILLPFR
jgi:signal transduction histidine kinase